MLFFSFQYIFLFLPVVVLGYFWLCGRRMTTAAQAWLVFASLFFYGWWRADFLPVILASILFNWAVSATIHHRGDTGHAGHRAVLMFGIAANLLYLGWFKYTDFVIENTNRAFHTSIPALDIVLPLAISFFTFQQVAFLVDSYQGIVRERNFLNYCLFVTFFPQLISGPIVHHREMMPQFASLRRKLPDFRNIALGTFYFSLGLIKKVLIADTFAIWAIAGFDQASELNVVEGWLVSLSYTLQLYFDFSGYMDMALGAALLFNIRLPINFDSPYKARSIQDFWRRWHITLSRFLRDYLYIPLGGNRKGEARAMSNVVVTFVLGGLWHGPAWTFVFWGLLHGLAAAVHRAWRRLGVALPLPAAWAVTFLFINAAWVFFRAKSWDDAVRVLEAMVGLGTPLGGVWLDHLAADWRVVPAVALGLVIAVFGPNSHELAARFRATWVRALAIGAAAGATATYAAVNANRVTEFIYFWF